MTYTITLPLPPSVNSAYGGGSGQKRFKNKFYKEWLLQCPKLDTVVKEYPVHITYKFYWRSNRDADGQNYMKLTTDYLVKQGVLIDDCYRYVASEDWKHGGVDKHNPRVEIEIRGL